MTEPAPTYRLTLDTTDGRSSEVPGLTEAELEKILRRAKHSFDGQLGAGYAELEIGVRTVYVNFGLTTRLHVVREKPP